MQGFLGLASSSTSASTWDLDVVVNGILLPFRIDTGADESVLSEALFNRHFSELTLRQPLRVLCGPDGTPLNVVGMVTLQLACKGNHSDQNIFIVRGLKKNLLGSPAIEDLRLLAQIDNVENMSVNPRKDYPQLFRGLGVIEGDYCLRVKSGTIPFAVTSPRKVPLPLYESTQEELREMERLGVISRVEEATEWCAPMVVVPKRNGKVRICVDLTELNRFVLREWYPIPSVEHTLGRLSGAKVFSKIDANAGFWQVPLSSDSRLLTTFITPFGRFCFNRLPFGISSAPEHFQRRMTEVLEGLPGVICHMDDVLVFGSTRELHDARLRAVLDSLTKAGITLNSQKCVFGVETVDFLGNTIAADGIRPNKRTLDVITNIPALTSRTELRRLLGLATYLGRIVPRLSDLLAPLTSMLSSKSEFVWEEPQREAFLRWKEILSSSPVLGIYDVNRETIVSADASSYGLGAVLLQEQDDGSLCVIAYASRTLSDTERRYAQIEREGLALAWACDRFQEFLIGRSFRLETDHKPLVTLLSTKFLDDLTPRLQRIRMRLMRYSYTVTYVPAKQLIAADALSRNPVQSTGPSILDQEVGAYVRMVESSLPVTSMSIKAISTAQKDDKICQALIKFSTTGWPSRRDLSPEMKDYWECRNSITFADNLLMFKDRIVVPASHRKYVLQQIHSGHQGMVKCKARAKDSVWWPSIAQDIENFVRSCIPCTEHAVNRKEPLLQTHRSPGRGITVNTVHPETLAKGGYGPSFH
ncbi:uncharacterized protein K02A2.6-like [Ornithodoros turicata]|uniref:uncharacterized protein K02A2.6-like n=1 Tax=Ornithodoros turicata TaxID=34597 RepID=UPI0031396E5D